MKIISKIMIIVILLTIIVRTPANADSNRYVIDKYIVNVVVLEDGILEVEEIITVDFQYDMHGIYREIPMSGKYKIKAEGMTSVERFNCDVYDVNVEGYNFDEYIEGKNYIIKMGDADNILKGIQEYKFNYTLNFGNEKNDSMDWLYFNLIGPTWDATINEGHFTIEMPKEFNAENVSVYTGLEGTKANIFSEYYVEDNTIYIDMTKELPAHKAVTFQILLEDGYFAEKMVVQQPFSINDIDITYVAMFALVALMLLVWLMYGKNPKLIPDDTTSPPMDLTPAEIGYVLDGVVDDKDVTSMLMYWASLGLISIKEEKRKYIITKRHDKPVFKNEYETELFYNMFKSRVKKNATLKSVSTKEIGADPEFYKTINYVKSEIKNKFKNNKEGGIYTRESRILKIISVLLCATPYLLCISKVHMELSEFLAPFLVVYVAGSIFLTYGFRNLNNFIGVNIRRRKVFSWLTALLFPITIIFPFYFMGKAIITFTNDYTLMYAVFISTTIIGILAANMHKPTQETMKIRQKIVGFKKYIESMGSDKIDAVLSENKRYFHDVLAYTYVLNMFGAWPDNFERMILDYPNWYIADYNPRRFSLPRFGGAFDTMSSDLTFSINGFGGRGSGGGGGAGGMGGGGGAW